MNKFLLKNSLSKISFDTFNGIIHSIETRLSIDVEVFRDSYLVVMVGIGNT